MNSNNPYYFSGVSDPNLEIWALVDETSNIVLVDQNLFALKLVELIPFTNSFRIVRLTDVLNAKTITDTIDNSNCSMYKVYGDRLIAADSPENSQTTQDKLFTLRHEYFKALEQQVSSDFLQATAAASVLLLMFGNDMTAFQSLLQEISRFGDDVSNLNTQIRQAYESH
jgi:hypothetical protein